MKLLTLILLTALTTLSAHATPLVHNKLQNSKDQYFIELIELALSKVGKTKSFELQQTSETLNQDQLVEGIKFGSVSILWAGTQPTYEQNLRPIRVPLLKGLQGHRLFIINKHNQANFHRIHSLADLKTLNAGQGRSWGDTQILRDAGLNVVTAVKKESLFYMVDGGRFDYFPLAVHEPWDEIRARPDLELSVDKELLLIYPMPMYFFVSRDNEELAQAIEQGLNLAIADGSFDQVFYQAPHIKSALQQAQLANRRVIEINNPNLSPATPLDRKELWLDLAKVM
ncbi:diguanylate cyclase [Neiella sp. HB171785]|uniref:Diguanylate cyclase n=1 Tax=Neiella litorisoli TaxID=2771431 RepID=A0A8J6QIE9_9GAMM|nr:diguanylate cyclase [Neiella litorisoli]MBD1389157.1 diguanylate cyclase [Neiella litorisoli]